VLTIVDDQHAGPSGQALREDLGRRLPRAFPRADRAQESIHDVVAGAHHRQLHNHHGQEVSAAPNPVHHL
jgi:hypothetical protein